MYNGAKNKIIVNGSCSDEFEIKVGVQQGLVLSPLLFITDLKLSREVHTSCPQELLMLLIAETFDFLMEKLKLWKDDMKNKGLHVNMGKTKLMI